MEREKKNIWIYIYLLFGGEYDEKLVFNIELEEVLWKELENENETKEEEFDRIRTNFSYENQEISNTEFVRKINKVLCKVKEREILDKYGDRYNYKLIKNDRKYKIEKYKYRLKKNLFNIIVFHQDKKLLKFLLDNTKTKEGSFSQIFSFSCEKEMYSLC